LLISLIKTFKIKSRFTSSEPQVQEEAACTHPADVTTGVLFTVTNYVKFPSAVTWLSWALPLSYYRASTFLQYRISKLKMNELSATIVKSSHSDFYGSRFPI